MRAYVARGVNLEAARPLLNDSFDDSILANDLPRQLELLALRAWLELQNGEEEAARKTLSRAEALVDKTGYVRVLLDILALAARMSSARRADQGGITTSPAEAEQLLTDREQAVLALLAGDLTYGQIAEALVW